MPQREFRAGRLRADQDVVLAAVAKDRQALKYWRELSLNDTVCSGRGDKAD